jgi:endonuclease/exonuclease/phosphatase family metal-dependent hydrolase
LESQLLKPLDVFIVNLHLTTLVAEREGIPDIDEEASQTRLRQLDIVLNGIVSRYNRWRKDGYKIRGKAPALRKGKDTDKRYPPIWVITGDFNFTPESVEYQTMVRRGFIDMMPKRARHQVPHHQPTKAPGIGNDPTITLDYLFAGPRFEAIDPSYNEDHIGNNRVDTDEIVRVSDHYPLIVDLPIRLD